MHVGGSGNFLFVKGLVSLRGLLLFAILLASPAFLATVSVDDVRAANARALNFAQLNDAAGPEKSPDDESESAGGADNETTGNNSPDAKSAENEDEETYPEIMRDLGKLPFPVRRMRELILDAAKSGDIEKLRPLIGYGDDVTMLSLGGIEEDPLMFLKSLSGDKDGHEILAILAEVLESGFVLMDGGTESELYVWPYFFAWPLDKLDPIQRVELFRLVTYGDYEDMESFGAYIFYRLGITPRGRWRFFVAGD